MKGARAMAVQEIRKCSSLEVLAAVKPEVLVKITSISALRPLISAFYFSGLEFPRLRRPLGHCACNR